MSIETTQNTIKIKKKSLVLHDSTINKDIHIKNKGTGAGGSNTNKNDIINFIINYK